MAQRVDYMVLPNTMDQILLDRSVTVLAHVEREKPDFKSFRTWLREQNLWKKEETPKALDLIGVRGLDGRGSISLTPIGKRLLAAEAPKDRQVVLFRHLLDSNPILVKYVIEALDTEAGGRLHSTHELYRYITSYAYPGEYIRLTDFQSFVKWLQAAGGIRIIGIRWGLDENGKANLQKIRGLDVEEILEDEALEAEEAEEDEREDATEPAAGAAAPAPSPSPAAAPLPTTVSPGGESAAADDFGDDAGEDFPDMPPEAPGPPIDEAAARRFEEQLGITAAPVAPPVAAAPVAAAPVAAAPAAAAPAAELPAFAPARPERTAAPVAAPVMRPLRSPVLEGGISPQERLETVKKVKAWWAGFPHKRQRRAADLGVEAAQYAEDPRRFVVRLMTAAVLVDHEAPAAPIGDFLRRLDEVDAFSRIGAGGEQGGLEAVLADLDWFDGNLWYQRLAENLVHAARFRRRIDASPETLDAILQVRGGKQAAERVFHELFGGAFYLPPFWLVREMYALGLWEKQAFAAVACVPSYPVRLAAFRLGFLDTYYADGFPALLQMSQVLSRFFDADCDFDAPLAQLADGFGCQHRCPHVLDCPLACREKYSI